MIRINKLILGIALVSTYAYATPHLPELSPVAKKREFVCEKSSGEDIYRGFLIFSRSFQCYHVS